MLKNSERFRQSVNNIVTNFSRIFNVPVDLSKPVTKSLTIPGLAYTDFTRAGIPAIWNIVGLIDTVRLFHLRYPQFSMLRFNELHAEQGKIIVISAQCITVSEAFYKRAAMKLPMTLSISPGRLGTKSLTKISCLHEKSSGELFATIEQQMSYIDPHTRMVTDIPDVVRERFNKDSERKSLPHFRIAVSKKPDEVFTYRLTVPHSDSDMLYHTNQAAFIKYTMDCASTAQQAGFLRCFETDLFAIPIKTVEVLYKAEAFIGDALEIDTWQDPLEVYKLHFLVQRGDKEIAFASITFYKEIPAAKM